MSTNADKKTNLPIFRERLNKLKGDLTVDRFAKKIGISRSTMGFYLAGKRLPKADDLKNIAEKCGVSSDYLIGLSDAQSTNNRDISSVLGLSDEAIEVLRQAKENPFRHFSYDRIITDKIILPAITQYLCAFLEYERLNSRYNVVPSYGLSDGYADRRMIAILTYLPKWKHNAIIALKAQPQLFEQLLFEYVVSRADKREYLDKIYNQVDYEDEEEYFEPPEDYDIEETLEEREEVEKFQQYMSQKMAEEWSTIVEVMEYRKEER